MRRGVLLPLLLLLARAEALAGSCDDAVAAERLSAARAGALAFRRRAGAAADAACAAAWAAKTRDDAVFRRAIRLEAAAAPRAPPPSPAAFARRGGDFYADPACSAFLDGGRGASCAVGPPPARSAAVVPAIREPELALWWPAVGLAAIAQDGWLRTFDAATSLWPAGAALAFDVADACGAWRGTTVLELGCGVGAAAVALARCGAAVVATDREWRALELAASNAVANGVRVVADAATRRALRPGAVAPTRLDWDDDDAIASVRRALGPFDAVLGAALRFEDWPPGRLFDVAGRLAGRAVFAHAGDVAPGAGWTLARAAPATALGLDDFATLEFVRDAAPGEL